MIKAIQRYMSKKRQMTIEMHYDERDKATVRYMKDITGTEHQLDLSDHLILPLVQVTERDFEIKESLCSSFSKIGPGKSEQEVRQSLYDDTIPELDMEDLREKHRTSEQSVMKACRVE